MALTFALVERTPYMLRYSATVGGQDGSGTIPNTGTGTPDLGGDADAAGPQILALVDTAAGSQAAARTLLNGDSLTTGGSVQQPRGRIKIFPRNNSGTGDQWSADANTSGGRAVITVLGPDNDGAIAYIELHFRHSQQR